MSLTASAASAVFTLLADKPDDERKRRWEDQLKEQRDLYTQFVISSALGLSAFLTFCILRPKWTELYAARRRQRNAASQLPELPDTLFGWIPVLYRISEDEVLQSAGLDAYVFLSFFKFAIRFLLAVFIFAVAIILPMHYKYTGQYGVPGWDNVPENQTMSRTGGNEKEKPVTDPVYLWIYVLFAYVFSGLAIYMLLDETKLIIRTRQTYLGNQTSTTDRTIRLSGIPNDLGNEHKIKEFVEGLRVGNVESITVCRQWRELDELIDERMKVIRELERAWTKYMGYKRPKSCENTLPLTEQQPRCADDEWSRLLPRHESEDILGYSNERPKVRIWYGPFKLRSRMIDAIDYYEEKLRKIDEHIQNAREKEYLTTEIAFVTMESIAASQMLVQAILDPHPMQMFARLAPAPADVIWKNTYLPRTRRMIQSWSITFIIAFLTVFWSVLLVPIASLLELKTLETIVPQLAEFLQEHPIIKSLVQTGLPTLAFSLLTVGVPYMYEWLSNNQGMVSRGDVELSVISKNFFFSFFNLFLLFTVFGTASGFYGFWESLRDAFKDSTTIALALANSLEGLAPFYINLLILQSLGIFPFRLLEFGSVALYPFHFLSARTPREYAELSAPPKFSYGLSIPQTILVLVICVVYSVFPSSWLICLFGLIYFTVGKFIYKYQLLYAMDHQQHSTGRAWPMICNRVFLGLLVHQLAMIGVLALRRAITRSLLLVPLLGFTVWFSYWFGRTYVPLMKFIALKSINRDQPGGGDISPSRSMTLSPPSGLDRDSLSIRIGGQDLGLRLKKYVNPSLIIPLHAPWLPGRHPVRSNGNGASDFEAHQRPNI
ncbi:hypothetical protein PDIG_28660 [Penicillium digitatum PHI26]|uniref:DUF221 domain protein n=1 Tax=Penicillium digitatum (strain PHI26 / CECT 20796) TaxID=1170229 RepID=K9FZR4_PEND2|nr:hypothetical protein PDIG_28660 [Penicillium digitatum PHI26]KAG0157182.1 hypothetical protein PDIDSM_4367 [Penicillium digitatum]